MSINNVRLAQVPIQTYNTTTPEVQTKEPAEIKGDYQLTMISPLLAQMLLAQSKKITPASVSNVQGVTEAQKRVFGYKNELRDMLTHNKANIIAVILRTMNENGEKEFGETNIYAFIVNDYNNYKNLTMELDRQ